MNMDHMFIMRLAALLFGSGIASCLFPGKSRMSHVLFLLLILAETAVAHGRCVKMHTFCFLRTKPRLSQAGALLLPKDFVSLGIRISL